MLHQPTFQQSQVAVSGATANIDNDHVDEDESTSLSSLLESGASKKNIEQKSKNYHNKLIIDYTHEKRFESFKRDMYQVYSNV